VPRQKGICVLWKLTWTRSQDDTEQSVSRCVSFFLEEGTPESVWVLCRREI